MTSADDNTTLSCDGCGEPLDATEITSAQPTNCDTRKVTTEVRCESCNKLNEVTAQIYWEEGSVKYHSKITDEPDPEWVVLYRRPNTEGWDYLGIAQTSNTDEILSRAVEGKSDLTKEERHDMLMMLEYDETEVRAIQRAEDTQSGQHEHYL